MGVLERDFQSGLIKKLKKHLPGCIILKNDEQYLTGIPDLTVLYYENWGFLEVKKSLKEEFQPLQEHYLSKANKMSFGEMICPENEADVLERLFRFMNGGVR